MYLLDTHTLLWFLSNSPELSPVACETICSASSIYASYASLWEISIKKSLSKLKLPYTPNEIIQMCQKEYIQLLRLDASDLAIIENLPFIHRDPFDRLLIAQAQSRNLTIITRDTIIPKYEVRTLW